MSNSQNREEKFLDILDTIYNKVISGIPNVSQPIEEFADDYLKKNPDRNSAIKSMMNYQIAKCTTAGFAAGFGGLITLPITIPADLSSTLYVQMRMIACTAYMCGYDIHCDQVRTLIYACLVGIATNNMMKQFGIKAGIKFAQSGIKKIPGKILVRINQRVGFRFLTKFGSKGLINLGKLIPVAGAVISGGMNLAETRIIANRAYKNFVEGDFTIGETINDDSDDVYEGEIINE